MCWTYIYWVTHRTTFIYLYYFDIRIFTVILSSLCTAHTHEIYLYKLYLRTQKKQINCNRAIINQQQQQCTLLIFTCSPSKQRALRKYFKLYGEQKSINTHMRETNNNNNMRSHISKTLSPPPPPPPNNNTLIWNYYFIWFIYAATPYLCHFTCCSIKCVRRGMHCTYGHIRRRRRNLYLYWADTIAYTQIQIFLLATFFLIAITNQWRCGDFKLVSLYVKIK